MRVVCNAMAALSSSEVDVGDEADKRVHAFLHVDRVETRGRLVISFGQLGGRRRRVSSHRFYFAALDALDKWKAEGMPTVDEFLEANKARAPWLAAASTGRG